MAKNNPFTIMFGREPNQYIKTPLKIAQVVEEFTSDNPPTQLYAITGVRGSGKTVMMNMIKEEFVRMDEWIIIRLIINSEESLIKMFASKLYDIPKMNMLFVDAKIDLSKFGIGVTIEKPQSVSGIETAIEKMLDIVKKNNKRILILIDEVSNNENVRNFASLFQAMISENMPIYLLMTGLPQNFYNLSAAPNMTFLKRAPRIIPDKLNYTGIKNVYMNVFSVSDEKAHEMYNLTKGYAYAFQLLGYLLFNSESDEITSIIDEYDQYLAEFVYQPIWEEIICSEYDQKIVRLIAEKNLTDIVEIKKELKMNDNSFNQCKQRLIRKGVLENNVYGKANINLPRFEEFVKKI